MQLRIGWIALFLLLAGCKRKEGCKDPNATNYCPECKKAENGSCEFAYTLGFWFDSTFSARLRQNGIDTFWIKLSYFDPQGNFQEMEVGGYLSSQYFREAPPTCEHPTLQKHTLRYRLDQMPHVCPSGGILGGGSRCWTFNYTAVSSRGVEDDSLLVIGPGESGCHLVQIK